MKVDVGESRRRRFWLSAELPISGARYYGETHEYEVRSGLRSRVPLEHSDEWLAHHQGIGERLRARAYQLQQQYQLRTSGDDRSSYEAAPREATGRPTYATLLVYPCGDTLELTLTARSGMGDVCGGAAALLLPSFGGNAFIPATSGELPEQQWETRKVPLLSGLQTEEASCSSSCGMSPRATDARAIGVHAAQFLDSQVRDDVGDGAEARGARDRAELGALHEAKAGRPRARHRRPLPVGVARAQGAPRSGSSQAAAQPARPRAGDQDPNVVPQAPQLRAGAAQPPPADVAFAVRRALFTARRPPHGLAREIRVAAARALRLRATLDPTALELVWSRRAKRSQLAVAPRPDHAKAEAAHRRLKISEEGAVQVTAGVKRWENQARSNSKGREGHDKRGSTRELGRTGRPSIALLRITDYTISPDYYNNDFTIKYAERVGEEGGDELALVAHSAAAKSVWNVVLADLMHQRQKELRIATAQQLTHAERQHMARVTHLVSSESLRELHSERHAVMTQSPDVSLGSLPGIGGGSSGLARIVSQAQGSDAGG